MASSCALADNPPTKGCQGTVQAVFQHSLVQDQLQTMLQDFSQEVLRLLSVKVPLHLFIQVCLCVCVCACVCVCVCVWLIMFRKFPTSKYQPC